MQLFEPHIHQVNPTERAIQNFKNHLISVLIIGDDAFYTVLWSYLLSQDQDSLNLLRKSRSHPQLLACQILEGVHDFKRHSWDPPATWATIFNPPGIQSL